VVRLPVSGMAVSLRAPDGADDLAILEVRGSAVARALQILPRLAQATTGERSDTTSWASVTVTDFEVTLLVLRVHLFGDVIACALDCPNPDCGERVEAEFRIADFLDALRPRQPPGVRAAPGRPGWFCLDDGHAAFRLPTAGDQAEVIGAVDAPRRLGERCIDPPVVPGRLRHRIERAMEQLAPEVSRHIDGSCPHCGHALSSPLFVSHLVMEELRRAAGGVHDEIHLIASRYHWSEADILGLPRSRRRGYAERIRRADREGE